MNHQPPTRRPPLSLSGLLEVGGAVLGLATFTGFLGKLWWVLELTSHFRLHLAAAMGTLALVWVWKRRWRWAAFCGGFAGINAVLVLALFWPAGKTVVSSGTVLRLAAINVHTANQRTDLVLEFLRKVDADVILLMEVDERWMTALEPLRMQYPEVVAEPREDNFGIALFSRVASSNSAVVHLGRADLPSITLTIEIGGQSVFLLGTHPLPPGSAENARLRNEQLLEIAAAVRRCGSPAIVIGDLNVTPWSPYFTELLRESGLRNTSQGLGLHSSWPSVLPVGRIPLDHCLISSSILVLDKQLGPHVGSDHLPVVVDLKIPSP